jgi:hypothetical protein
MHVPNDRFKKTSQTSSLHAFRVCKTKKEASLKIATIIDNACTLFGHRPEDRHSFLLSQVGDRSRNVVYLFYHCNSKSAQEILPWQIQGLATNPCDKGPHRVGATDYYNLFSHMETNKEPVTGT